MTLKELKAKRQELILLETREIDLYKLIAYRREIRFLNAQIRKIANSKKGV